MSEVYERRAHIDLKAEMIRAHVVGHEVTRCGKPGIWSGRNQWHRPESPEPRDRRGENGLAPVSSIRRFDPVARTPQVLTRAGLAALPELACELRVYSLGLICSGEYILRFVAQPNDIERFLAESPSLKGIACRIYSRVRASLQARNHGETFDRRHANGHEYFNPSPSVPRWYKEDIQGAGGRYEINWREPKGGRP